MYNTSFKQHSQVTNVKENGEEYYKTTVTKTRNKALNGGYIFKKPKVLSINITKTCKDINDFFKKVLNELLNDKLFDENNLKNPRPGPGLTFLIMMTELFECDQKQFVKIL